MKKYQTILADPPWEMDFVKLEMRPNQVEMPYPMMTIRGFNPRSRRGSDINSRGNT